MGRWGTRHHQQTAGVFIKAVHNPGSRELRERLIAAQKRILQG